MTFVITYILNIVKFGLQAASSCRELRLLERVRCFFRKVAVEIARYNCTYVESSIIMSIYNLNVFIRYGICCIFVCFKMLLCCGKLFSACQCRLMRFSYVCSERVLPFGVILVEIKNRLNHQTVTLTSKIN